MTDRIARLRREWPISINSPHLGTRPVNPDGPEAATALETMREALTAIEKSAFVANTTDSDETRHVALESIEDIARSALAKYGEQS